MRYIVFWVLFSFFELQAQNIKINEICASNYLSFEDSYDEHGDWVEFYNAGSSSVNMAGMYLTDNFSNLTKFQIPSGNSSATTISGHNHRVFWLDDETYKGPTHVNFKLSNFGERIALVAADGVTIIDSVTFGVQTYDISYGRRSDGSSTWTYFPDPTPDDDNSGGGYDGLTGNTIFNLDAGFYSSAIQVELTTADSLASVYYTLNGEDPSPSSGTRYTGPISINSSKVVRARVFRSDYIPGEIITKSYFINRPIDLAVLSVATDPSNLWDEDDGIYCFGDEDDYDHYYPYYGANFWQDWKKPAHIEFFEQSGAEVISQNLKISISGNTSRVYAQKSLNFEAESAFGKNVISYQLFPKLPITEYKSFKLRNGGSDWSSTGIRDAYNHTLLEGATDVDHQSNRPVILYLNGEYWGIMNMTEKIDADYLKAHYPQINKDSVDLLYSDAEVKYGDADSYNDMIDFISSNSLSQQSNYNYIKTQIDIQEFINYFQSRIYYATTDWPHKNIYYWRPKDQSMKWRWIMWDTDRSDLLTTDPSRRCNYDDNTLEWATTSNSVASWAQFLLNNLLRSTEFKTQFITQYAHHMNFTFCPLRTDSVLNVFRSRLNNELPAHITRWEDSNDTLDYYTAGYYHSVSEWNTEVDTITRFFGKRAKYMRKFVMQQFSIDDTSVLSLDKVPPQGGIIEIDTFRVPENHCSLVYFDDYPVTLKAIANPGYVFAGWTTSGGSTLPLLWEPDGDTTITAFFQLLPPVQPTIPSSSLISSVLNCSDIHLTWTPGNGSSRLVICKASSPVNIFPTDQHSYVADSVFGMGNHLGGGNYVVYSGNSNSCSLSGLSAGITYYFAIIEFNGIDTTCVYNTTHFLSGNRTAASFSFSVSSSVSLCAGSSTTLSATGGLTYRWDPLTGLSSDTGSSVSANPTHSTVYTVTAWDIDSCQLTSEIAISVNNLPSVNLGNDTTICMYENVSLDAGFGFADYQWSTGASTQSIVIDGSVSGLGTFIYSVNVIDTSGCVTNDEIAITIDICTSKPNLPFHLIPDIYPNPFTEQITIRADQACEISMYDMLGNIVFKKLLNAHYNTITPVLASGIYFLKIQTNNGNSTVKLVKTE